MPHDRDPNEVGALWEKMSASGVRYMSGTIDGKRIVVFENKNKRTEKHPDWKVLLSTPRP